MRAVNKKEWERIKKKETAMLRTDIENIIVKNKDPQIAALKIVDLLETKIGLHGNVWFEAYDKAVELNPDHDIAGIGSTPHFSKPFSR